MDDGQVKERFKCVLDDKEYISRQFEYHIGYHPNLDSPQTFNEKIQWLKLHDRNPEYTKLVDKYEVKKYIADKIGEQHAVPTLGIYDSFDEIDFTNYPMQFVLKCTHDSGSLVICKDKAELDRNKARKKLQSALKKNFFGLVVSGPIKMLSQELLQNHFCLVWKKKDLLIISFCVWTEK